MMDTVSVPSPGWKAVFQRGLQSGLSTTWTLAKIIFPVTFIVVVLQHTPVIDWLVRAVSPAMGIFGLRGEAAIPLVLGLFLNLYAAIAAMLSLTLTVKEAFILAVMISFAHNMLVETGVALRVGVRLWVVLLVRLGLAVLWALIINYGWQGGSEIARYTLAPAQEAALSGWGAILLSALHKATSGTLQVAIIVLPLMLSIQFMKEHGWLQVFSRVMGPFTRLVGIDPKASLTLVAGAVAGLAYGAGIMIQNVEEDGVSPMDANLAMIFLMACHAVVEDTVIFMALGIPVWALFTLRLGTAILVTAVASWIWRAIERRKATLAEPADEQPAMNISSNEPAELL